MAVISGRQITTASLALTGSLLGTASYALFAANGGGGSGAGFPFSGNAVITGSLLVSGSGITTSGITTNNTIKVLSTPASSYQTASIQLGSASLVYSDNGRNAIFGIDSGLYASTELTAFGFGAASSSQGGWGTFVGSNAGIGSNGNDATMIGHYAGSGSVGINNTAVGTYAGINNLGSNTIAIGTTAGGGNTKDDTILIGRFAGYLNNGLNLVAIGPLAAYAQTVGTPNNVVAIGNSAGYNDSTATGNIYSNVNLFGYRALASANNQLVFVRSGSGFSYNAQFDANGISADRKFTLPNSSSIIPLSVNGTGSNSTGNITLTNIPSASFATTASYAITYTTALFVTSSTTAQTASFITSSGVYGPYGSDSITTASYAETANSASYALTASYALNGGGGGGGTLSYGSFYTNQTQTLSTTAGQLSLNSALISNGISLGENSINIVTTGIYNFQISVTIQDENGVDEVDFYLHDLTSNTLQAASAKTVFRSVSGAKQLITWSCLLSLSAQANIALYGASSSDTKVSTVVPNNGGYPITINVIKIASA